MTLDNCSLVVFLGATQIHAGIWVITVVDKHMIKLCNIDYIYVNNRNATIIYTITHVQPRVTAGRPLTQHNVLPLNGVR